MIQPQNDIHLTEKIRHVIIPLVLKFIWQGLCDLFYPPNCLICKNFIPRPEEKSPPRDSLKNIKEFLCPECTQKISYNFPPFCVQCSRHLSKPLTHSRCKECLEKKPHFDFAWSACLYQEPLQGLIHQFKYGQKTLLRHVFRQFVASFLRKYNFDIHQFDMVIPIPLSSTRQRERGYNQAQLLAQDIAQEFNLTLCARNLVRIRHTQNQALLSEKERWTNIQRAFRIKQPQAVFKKSVLLIDDLLTTGATTSEAALTLKEAGANIVGVLTLAITSD